MNNKGFAISGMIYSILIIFLLVLVTIITSLSTTRKLLVNSSLGLENTYLGISLTEEEITNINKRQVILYKGKYIFKVTNNNGEVIDNCVGYYNENTNFSEIKELTPSICNINIMSKELVKGYSFREEN